MTLEEALEASGAEPVNDIFRIENTPLPSEKALEDMQKNISGSEKEVSELEIKKNRDK